MNKITITVFSIALLSINLYGLLNDSYYFSLIFNSDITFVFIRLLIIGVLVAYVFLNAVRLYSTRFIMLNIGLALIMLGVVSAFTTSIFGFNTSSILIGDSLVLIEAGALSIISGLELSARRSRFMINSFNSTKYYLQGSTPKIPTKMSSYSARLIQTKTPDTGLL